jgi:hypothetical protein
MDVNLFLLKLFAIVFLKKEQRENMKRSWRERVRETAVGERDGLPEVRWFAGSETVR